MESEQLKPEEFDAHIKNGTFRLAFVGMSNAGKSYRSRILHEQADFEWYHVDEEIRKALKLETPEDVSQWMGYPSTAGYKKREKEYLELEDTFTKHAAMRTNGKNLVFDTTGSVIYLEQGTLHTLKENCLIVHLDVGEDSVEQLVERLFNEPKPVIWAGYFARNSGESEEAALRRCYPELLRTRLKEYRALAHMNIPVAEVRDKSAKETLGVIRSYLV